MYTITKIKHRCSKCGARHTFGQDWSGPMTRSDWKSCKKCGHQRFYRVKNERTCRCDAYAFPHRAGGGCCQEHATENQPTRVVTYAPEPEDYVNIYAGSSRWAPGAITRARDTRQVNALE